MADDDKNTLTERIKSSRYYSIQLDETTDVADLANLLVYVRYEYDGTAGTEGRWLIGEVLFKLFKDGTAWLHEPACLFDIFSCLNELNVGLQWLSNSKMN